MMMMMMMMMIWQCDGDGTIAIIQQRSDIIVMVWWKWSDALSHYHAINFFAHALFALFIRHTIVKIGIYIGLYYIPK